MGASESSAHDGGVLGCCTSGSGVEKEVFESSPRKLTPKPFAVRSIAEGRRSHSSSSGLLSQSPSSSSPTMFGSSRSSTRSYSEELIANEMAENKRVTSGLDKKRLSAHLRMVHMNKNLREHHEEEEEDVREELDWFKGITGKKDKHKRKG